MGKGGGWEEKWEWRRKASICSFINLPELTEDSGCSLPMVRDLGTYKRTTMHSTWKQVLRQLRRHLISKNNL